MNPTPPSSSALPGQGDTGDTGAAGGAGGAEPGRSFDRAVNATHEAVDRAAASMDRAAQRVREGYEHACAVEREWADACRDRVREHPLACVAVALAAGVVVGSLCSRSHR